MPDQIIKAQNIKIKYLELIFKVGIKYIWDADAMEIVAKLTDRRDRELAKISY